MAVRFQSGIDYGQVAQGIEQNLQRAQQFVSAGIQTFIDQRTQEQKFANTVLENIESLKEEGDLAHQKIIAEEVDKLYNEAKDSIYKYRTNKKGKVKFDGYDFDPETLRSIKNKARNLKNAALRSEQLRTAYDTTLKTIAVDPTIINKSSAIEQATNTFKNRDILFKGDSINPDNPVLTFNKIIEGNVDLPTAINTSINALAGGRTTDVGFTTPDGRSEVTQYNVDYFTPKYSGNEVVGFEPNEKAINELALRVFSSREGISTRASFDQVKQEVMQALNPISKIRMTAPTVEKPSEADVKRGLETRRYMETEKVFNDIARNKINKGEKLTDEDFTRINRAAGKGALTNVDFIDVEKARKDFNQNANEIVKSLSAVEDKRAKKELQPLIDNFNSLGPTEKITVGLKDLVEQSQKILEEREIDPRKMTKLFEDVAPMAEFITRDYGYIIKDRRGKDTSFSFVDNADSFSRLSSTLFDVPTTVPVEEAKPEKTTIPGF